jgi:amidase
MNDEADDNLWQLSALEGAALIVAAEVSSRELIESHLQRIRDINPEVGAITAVLDDAALAAADDADRAVRERQPLGPLHGVPFTVKENIDVEGSATTNGVPAFAEAIATADAPSVERLRAAGAIPLARTNLPDLALRFHTDSALHGPTRNPWQPERTASGSSGGEAAAIATGMSPLGLGTDIGGSLRNPAFCCGISALKPGFGRVPRASCFDHGGSPPTSQYMAAHGPMARRIDDLAAAFEVIAGPHPRDPFTFPAPPPSPPESGLRVAVLRSPPGSDVHPDIAWAIDAAADALTGAGYETVVQEPPLYEEATQIWRAWLLGEIELMQPLLDPLLSAPTRRYLDLQAEISPGSTEPLALELLSRRHAIATAWSEFFAEFELVLAPVWTQPAFLVGHDIADLESAREVDQMVRPIAPANLLGLPAMAIPVGVREGIPVGVQLIADRFREDRCLNAARAIEQAIPPITPIEPRSARAPIPQPSA